MNPQDSGRSSMVQKLHPLITFGSRYFDLLVIFVVLCLTIFCTVEAPTSDDWDLVPLLKASHAGSLTIREIDTPYAGHNIAIPYLYMIFMASVTHWNSYVFHVINVMICCVAWLAIRPLAIERGRLISVSLLFWSFNQFMCWLWTWMVMSCMTLCFVLWSLRLIASKTKAGLYFGLLLAVAATFTWTAGLAVWPAIIYLVLLKARPLEEKLVTVIAIVATALAFAAHPAASHDMAMGNHIWNMPMFFLFALGAPIGFAAKGTAAILAGTALLIVLISRPWQSIKDDDAICWSIGITAAGMIALVVAVRGGGVDHIAGMDSRYGAISALCWVAIILLGDWSGWRRYALWVFLAMCLLRDLTRVNAMLGVKRSVYLGVQGVIHGTNDRFALKGDHTSQSEFDEDVRQMRAWHYSFMK